MINKKIGQISLQDINDLIDNQVSEGRTIDYKRELSLSTPDQKKEILYDISSFANANGGDIVFGVEEGDGEKDGIPIKIIGIEIPSIDKLTQQLDSIDPRLPLVSYQFIYTQDNKYVLIIRINRSWNKPHQVIHSHTDKFYTRSNNGKYPMDVNEIRNQFISSDSLKQKITRFRNDRISSIIANQGSVPLTAHGKIILHIAPLISFESGYNIDLTKLISEIDLLKPAESTVYPVHYNFEGLISYDFGRSGQNTTYLQVFRNGIIESVDGFLINPGEQNKKILYIDEIEKHILDLVSRIPAIHRLVDIVPPCILSLTITDVKDFYLGENHPKFTFNNRQINSDHLVFNDLLIEDWNSKHDLIVKPWFDNLWNIFGIPESPNYKGGDWIRPR